MLMLNKMKENKKIEKKNLKRKTRDDMKAWKGQGKGTQKPLANQVFYMIFKANRYALQSKTKHYTDSM